MVADRYLKYYSRGKFERHWTANDILAELFTKILEGERNWDPEQVPDFNKFILQNIRSIVEGRFRYETLLKLLIHLNHKLRQARLIKDFKMDNTRKKLTRLISLIVMTSCKNVTTNCLKMMIAD